LMLRKKPEARTISPWCYYGLSKFLRTTAKRRLLSDFRSLLAVFLAIHLAAEPTVPSTLSIQVLEGAALTPKSGSISYDGCTVLVTDGQGHPIPNAKVQFRLPEKEPTGRFPDGKNWEEQSSDAQGRASTWGIRWGQAGVSNLTIIARLGAATAGTTVRVNISGTSVLAPPKAEQPKSPPPKKEAELSPPKQPSFEVAAAPPPAASKEVLDSDESSLETSISADKRPGVMLQRTAGPQEHIPNPKIKWALLGIAIAGGIGGGVYYKLTRQTPVVGPVEQQVPQLILRLPNVSVGKP
jgi:hypothetical protein